MKKISFTLVAMCMIFLISTTDSMAEAKLEIPSASFDFGFVPQHSRITHTYKLVSAGTDTLRIEEVRPGCGCTQTPLEKKMLAPGESTDLEVVYTTRVYQGKQSKRPQIMSNSNPTTDYVMFTANVMSVPDNSFPIKITPYKLNISRYGGNDFKEMEFTIKNVGEEDLEVNLIDLRDDMFKVELPKKIKAGKSEKGKIRINEEFLDREFEKSLTIELNDANKTRFTIPIRRTLTELSASDKE